MRRFETPTWNSRIFRTREYNWNWRAWRDSAIGDLLVLKKRNWIQYEQNYWGKVKTGPKSRKSNKQNSHWNEQESQHWRIAESCCWSRRKLPEWNGYLDENITLRAWTILWFLFFQLYVNYHEQGVWCGATLNRSMNQIIWSSNFVIDKTLFKHICPMSQPPLSPPWNYSDMVMSCPVCNCEIWKGWTFR